MAKIGASNPFFAPFAEEETASSAPTYAGGVQLGGLVKADYNYTFNSAELYADNALSMTDKEFASGSIAYELDDMTDETVATVYGITPEEDESLGFGGANDPPFGGLGHVMTIKRKGGGIYYKAIFYPKVQATKQGDSVDTKGNSVAFTTEKTSFAIYKPMNPAVLPIYENTFDSYAGALTWIKGKLNITEGVTGTSSTTIDIPIVIPEATKTKTTTKSE